MSEEIVVIAGTASRRFGGAVCRCLDQALAKTDVVRFSDGNIFVKISENVRGRHVFVIQSVAPPVNDNFMELLFWIDAAKRASASQVTAVIPYFSYAKGDKKDEPRVSIRARVCADAIEAAGADRVVTMDLHAPQIQGFFRIPVDDLYALPVLCDEMCRRKWENITIVSPDVGFAAHAHKFGQQLDAPVAIASKRRAAHDEKAEVMELYGTVKGCTAVIVDDFVVSGGTLIEAARKLREMGALRVIAAVTHGILPPGSGERIEQSPIEQLLVTDTIEHPDFSALPAKIVVVSVARLFARAIECIRDRASISTLFPQ